MRAIVGIKLQTDIQYSFNSLHVTERYSQFTKYGASIIFRQYSNGAYGKRDAVLVKWNQNLGFLECVQPLK